MKPRSALRASVCFCPFVFAVVVRGRGGRFYVHRRAEEVLFDSLPIALKPTNVDEMGK
jgi:hypothetical protein